MGQPLQFNPGSEEQYSNIGYLLLGLIAEQVTGKPLLEQFQQDLFAPLGVPSTQILAARTFAADQDSREPYYDGGRIYESNVFYPAHSSEPWVLPPYGSFDVEARIGQGGVVADPLALLEFLNNYQTNGPGIGGPRPLPGSWRWNHTGSQDGVSTLARQRGDGINYVVFFNKDSNGTSYSSQIRTIFDGIIDSNQISNWPTMDVREYVPEPSALVTVILAALVAIPVRTYRPSAKCRTCRTVGV
jgi:CubicO group peptidase (beta-lactamase class C family)